MKKVRACVHCKELCKRAIIRSKPLCVSEIGFAK